MDAKTAAKTSMTMMIESATVCNPTESGRARLQRPVLMNARPVFPVSSQFNRTMQTRMAVKILPKIPTMTTMVSQTEATIVLKSTALVPLEVHWDAKILTGTVTQIQPTNIQPIRPNGPTRMAMALVTKSMAQTEMLARP
jgi:hypothetical protein